MNLPHIQVTMLGTTSAGKTCFLLGMYATMRLGAKSFTFTTDENTDLQMSNQWEQLMVGEGDERWPRPTQNEVFLYHFAFCYALKKFASFDWIDYRGGALKEQSTAEDRQKLKRFLLASDCVICCIPADQLLASSKDRLASTTAVAIKSDVPRMLNLLQELPYDKRPAIAIVITKYDLISQQKIERTRVIEHIKTIFNTVFAPGGNWDVLICPVSLGGELAQNSDAGEIDPRNVHLPVTYAMYHALRNSLQDQEKQLLENKEKQQETMRQQERAEMLQRQYEEKNRQVREKQAHAEQQRAQARARHSELNSRNFLSRWWNSAEIKHTGEQASSYSSQADRYSKDAYAAQQKVEEEQRKIKASRVELERAEKEMQALLKLQQQMERSLQLLVRELMTSTTTYYGGEEVTLEA